MNGIHILAIKYADSILPESMAFLGGAKNVQIPIGFICYLLVTERSLVLVDAGCDTMPGFDMKNYIRPVDVLKLYGYEPESITDVIITHAHHDHIEAVKYYSNAVIHIQKQEYICGKKYIPEAFTVHVFDEDAVIDECITVKKIGGHSIGSCIVEFRKNGKTYVITGDECYVKACLDKKIPTGSYYCIEKSRQFIEKYSNGEYIVLLCHDSEVNAGYIED